MTECIKILPEILTVNLLLDIAERKDWRDDGIYLSPLSGRLYEIHEGGVASEEGQVGWRKKQWRLFWRRFQPWGTTISKDAMVWFMPKVAAVERGIWK